MITVEDVGGRIECDRIVGDVQRVVSQLGDRARLAVEAAAMGAETTKEVGLSAPSMQ